MPSGLPNPGHGHPHMKETIDLISIEYLLKSFLQIARGLELSFYDLSIVLEWSYCLSFITLPIFNRSTKILEDEVPLLKELGNFAKTTASERNG